MESLGSQGKLKMKFFKYFIDRVITKMEEEALDQHNKACQILPNIKFHRGNCENFFTDFFWLDLKKMH